VGIGSAEAVMAFSRWQRDMLELQKSFIDVKRQSALLLRYFEIGRSNPRLLEASKENPFPRGVAMWYGYYSSACIRRFGDKSPDSLSLVTMLLSMANSALLPQVFSDRVTADDLAEDVEAIRTITRREKHFVDRAICHTDRRGIDWDQYPTFNETHRTISALEPYFRKYCELFKLNGSLDPNLPPGWESIFSYPWITPP